MDNIPSNIDEILYINGESNLMSSNLNKNLSKITTIQGQKRKLNLTNLPGYRTEHPDRGWTSSYNSKHPDRDLKNQFKIVNNNPADTVLNSSEIIPPHVNLPN